MGKLCDIYIGIGSGTISNALTTYGFHLLSSPFIGSAPIREYETQEYPESEDAEVLLKTVKKPFDYKIEMIAETASFGVNGAIYNFWESLFTTTGDSMVPKLVTIYNYWKGEKIVGYAKSLEVGSYMADTEREGIKFSITFYVSDPGLCDFNLSPIRIALSAHSATEVDVTVDLGGSTATTVTIERSTDGGAWTSVYSGALLAYRDTVTADKDYAYRAKTNLMGYSFSQTINM